MQTPNETLSVQVSSRVLDKGEAAALLGTTTRHVERLVDRRQIGHLRVGRFVRFTLQDIEDYLARHHVAPAPEALR